MKVQKSTQNINSFGGLNFILNEIQKAGLPQLIDNELGKRVKQAEYQKSDVLINLWSIIFCGGDCADDVTEHLKNEFKSIPNFNSPSASTILRVLKNMKTEREKVISTNGNTYNINKNDNLNRLNIRLLKKINLLSENHYYDFDYDNEVLKTEKYDSKKTYKHVNGYFPGMATIDGMPVYLENRDGNMNVKTDQDGLLKRCFEMFDSEKIHINRARMDAGSYSQKIVDVVEANSKLFYIRANRCADLTQKLIENKNWRKVEINNIIYEVCSIDYKPFSKDKKENSKTYRLVVSREDVGNKQVDLLTGDTKKYRSILTNDQVSSEEEIIIFYNQRGNEERTIDILNNDFAWKKMPFSFLEENTVFLIAMMMCKNVYTWILRKFSMVFSDLKDTFRLKKFIFRFVTVPAKWIKHGRQFALKIFSSKAYDQLNLT